MTCALSPPTQQLHSEDTPWALALGSLRGEGRVPDLGSRLTAEPLDLGLRWVVSGGRAGPSLSGAQPPTLKTVEDPQPGCLPLLGQRSSGDRLAWHRALKGKEGWERSVCVGGAHRPGKAGPNLAVSYFRTVPWGPRASDIGGGESGSADAGLRRESQTPSAGRLGQTGSAGSVWNTVLPCWEGPGAWRARPVRGIWLS